jgi:nitrous oxidase accessory protein
MPDLEGSVLDSRRLKGVLYLWFSIALLSLSISAQEQSGGSDLLAGGGDMGFLVPSASALPEETVANTVGPVPGSGVDYNSIQEAIDDSKPGDVIRVLSGNYSENVEVNKTAIVLKGVDTGGGKPIVSGDGVGSTITLSADGCTLEGFVVMNSGNPHAGIEVRSNGNIIASNTVRWNRGYGIFVSNSTNNTVERNSISNNGFDGIFLLGSLGNDIFGNTINSNGMNGIRLVDSDENTIESNAIVNNALYGVLLERSNRNVIRENTILHNLKGGIRLVDSTGNIITRNNYDDISLENSEGNTIANNNQVERYGDDESDPSDEENEEEEEEPEDEEEGPHTVRVHPGERIQAAVDEYGSIYIIEVESGTYNENVDVDVPGTILLGIDTGGGDPIVHGDGVGDTVTMSGGGSTIDGFEVENSGNPHAGIRVTSDDNVISNMVVTDNKGYGIYVLNSRGNRIEDCTVEDNGNGSGFDAILLEGSSRNNISNCDIEGGNISSGEPGAGINLTDSELNVVSDNDIHGGSESESEPIGHRLRIGLNSLADF